MKSSGPRVMGLTPDKAAMPKARSVFAELARLLGEQPCLAGEAISLADLVAPQLSLFTLTREWSALVAPHKSLVAWLARMEARSSLKATTWERVSEMAQAA
jgi:glutathione S-transferase